jgi:NAD(P)-dependent dehydrogenase (short-subunit alcohol dehydrogenase family)
MTSLKDRVVVIVGAAGGMGSAIVADLTGAGVRLALADVNQAALAAIESQAQAAGAQVLSRTLDSTAEDQIAAFFASVKAHFGGADALIYLPGLSIPAKIESMAVEDYDRTFDVNVKGAFLAAKHFMQIVQPERGGQILLTSSMASKRANPNAPVYCAAKASLSMLAQGLALQAKDKNVRVTTLLPGPTNTAAFWGARPVPREKFMTTDDIALVVRFILDLPDHVVMHEVDFESFIYFKQ